MEKNSVPVNFIEEIEEYLQKNMIRAAKNKIPQYKTEVVQLKVEHENGFQKTLDDIAAVKRNKASILEEIERKRGLFRD